MDENNIKRRLAKWCLIPQRYVMAVMIFCAILINYSIRVSVDLTLRYMTQLSNDYIDKRDVLNDRCNFTDLHELNDESHGSHKHFWTLKDAQQVRSIFFYGYLSSHIPGGYLADKYGGKHVLGSSVLISAATTVLMPPLMHATKSVVFIKITRLMVGLAQGALFPASAALITSWTPRKEIGSIGGIVCSAISFATFLTRMFTVNIIQVSSWDMPFYIYGGVGVIWWLFWYVLGYSDPFQSSFISEKEMKHLRRELSGHVVHSNKEFPWFKILTCFPLWVLVLNVIGNSWIWFSMMVDLPKYMLKVLKYSKKVSHYYSALPYVVVGVLTVTLGILSDILINKYKFNRDAIRKCYTILGAMGPAIFILGATFTGCHRTLTLAFFSISFGWLSFYVSGTRLIIFDLAPNYSGIVMAFVNGIPSFTSVVYPVVEKKVLLNYAVGNWRKLYSISLIIATFTNLIFTMFGSTKEQSWNQPQIYKHKRSDKDRRYNRQNHQQRY